MFSVSHLSMMQDTTIDIKLPRRSLLVQFTCNECGERTQRFINRLAYERGLVFVQVFVHYSGLPMAIIIKFLSFFLEKLFNIQFCLIFFKESHFPFPLAVFMNLLFSFPTLTYFISSVPYFCCSSSSYHHHNTSNRHWIM